MTERLYSVVPDPNTGNDELREELERFGTHIAPFNGYPAFATLGPDERRHRLALANRFLANDLFNAAHLKEGAGFAATATGTVTGAFVLAGFNDVLQCAARIEPRQRLVGVIDDLRAAFVPAPHIAKEQPTIDVRAVPDEHKVLSVSPVLLDTRRETVDEEGAVIDTLDLSHCKVLVPVIYGLRPSLVDIVEYEPGTD